MASSIPFDPSADPPTPMAHDTGLTGRRILIVDDDDAVAEALSLTLESLGCVVVGPATTVEEARAFVRGEPIDAAVLDIALAGGTSAPVARALQSQDRPFLFITGYASMARLPDELRGRRVLLKPVDRVTLHNALVELLSRRRTQKIDPG